MKTIYKSLLLMGVCSSATVPSMAMTEEADSTHHQPLTETNVKLNEVVVTGLTGVSGNLVGISINLCKSIQKELFINDTP